ncbi:hypothetical protein KFL_007300075 [Klebsormidium nitens]|uniref:Uncharacterized protein n=1 Tax=Klebsormidium nitens TaxID=105231 RepID=A0A1Y1ILU2_KLENI|nr:hypothetical protein KFL_007300075 [Klebsormidium nitens]|eukprot:GAQ91122.1 hypothetical protein KFL_007300075 [Klebsormidium nitens]
MCGLCTELLGNDIHPSDGPINAPACGDLAYIESPTACEARCNAAAGCAGFVHVADVNCCFLKGKLEAQSANTACVTHLKTGLPGYVVAYGKEDRSCDPNANNPTANNPTTGNPTANNLTARNATAHNPTASNPTAHNPSANNPTADAVDPTAHQTTAGEHSAADEQRRFRRWGFKGWETTSLRRPALG